MLPTKFQVIWLLGFGEEAKKKDFHHGGHVGFQISTILVIYIYTSSRCFLPSLESTGLSAQEMKRIRDFQDSHHLRFPIGTILAIFDLQVTTMLPSKFRVNWPFGSGEEKKNRVSR